MHISFSIMGAAYLVLMLLPNIIWVRHRPEGWKQLSARENKWMKALEVLGQLMVCVTLVLYDEGKIHPSAFGLAALAGSALFMGFAAVSWLRYFRSGKTFADVYRKFGIISAPLAVLPVVALLLLAGYEANLPLAAAAAIFGFAHISIHRKHSKEILHQQFREQVFDQKEISRQYYDKKKGETERQKIESAPEIYEMKKQASANSEEKRTASDILIKEERSAEKAETRTDVQAAVQVNTKCLPDNMKEKSIRANENCPSADNPALRQICPSAPAQMETGTNRKPTAEEILASLSLDHAARERENSLCNNGNKTRGELPAAKLKFSAKKTARSKAEGQAAPKKVWRAGEK